MIPLLHLSRPADHQRFEALLHRLRLDPRELALNHGPRAQQAAVVQKILADVAERGDAALVDNARQFDDPHFTADQIRIQPQEMQRAAERISPSLRSALRRSIEQVREYQQHCLPSEPPPLNRPGVELGLRFTPIDSAGLTVPGGKASYPSTAIMLAVPAQVAGVKRIIACTPPSQFGRSDLLLAAFFELGLTDVFRCGGAAAIGAMAFGTQTVPAVDKIVGPGNVYVQLAKRALAGCVGIDGFLGPSEILTIADDTARADFIAADLIAQAEHDPGSCFLLTPSTKLADAVVAEISRQLPSRKRLPAIEKALREDSAIAVDESMDHLVDWANRFAAEHVNLQTGDDAAILRRLPHAGAVFVGPYSPVAAGDYIAGPSHCLPTNTTARFTSGISVFEFLKRGSVERYTPQGLSADAASIIELAEAEHLDGHAESIRIRANAR